MRREGVTHVVDATHPFAAQMSRNAIAACDQAEVPLTALTRAPWALGPGDTWIDVPDIASAVAALERPRERVMLAIGRMNLPAFAPNPQHFYLLRLVDPPQTPPPFPDHDVVIDRGPFRPESDLALMQSRDISLVVSKNSGGTGAHAKILAARRMGLPVIMIGRPHLPPRHELHDAQAVLAWLGHASTDLGV